MSFEEEFDSMMRQKANEMKFPFDEKNWEKAAAMIDAERRAAKAAKRINDKTYITPVAAILFVAGIIAGLVYYMPSSEQSKIAVNNNKITISAKKETQNTINAKLNTVSTNDKSVVENQTTHQAETVFTKQGKQQQTALFQNTEEPVSNVTKPNIADNNLTTINSNDAEETSQIISEETNISFEHNSIAAKETLLQFSENKTVKEEEIYFLSPVVAQISVHEEPEVNNLPLVILKRYDEDYYKNKAKHKTHYLNVELGGVYLLGWQTSKGRDGQGTNWFGGVNYGLYLSKKISLSAGLQTYNIRNINQAFYANQKTEYDFGAVISNTVITGNNLYYMAVPLKINYALDAKNQIALGTNAGYVVGAKNTVQTYEMKEGDIKVNSRSEKNMTLYENVNSLNLMVTASYRTEIIPRLFLSGELIYGVSDIFKNSKNIKNREQPAGLRLSLQYNLFDR